MRSYDPTAYDLGSTGDSTDPTKRHIRAFANHGGQFVDVPFITQVADNLWHGGCEDGLVLPEFIKHTVSLYPWEKYTVKHELLSSVTVKMFDSEDQGMEQVEALGAWVNVARHSGTVLVSCQAGLNRSSLVVASALVQNGDVANGREAIELIRSKRSPVCLCNPKFEQWVAQL